MKLFVPNVKLNTGFFNEIIFVNEDDNSSKIFLEIFLEIFLFEVTQPVYLILINVNSKVSDHSRGGARRLPFQ